MSEPTLSLEARVHALELALAASEQWNVCVCGHHGSAHNSWNKCLVCECPHFGTRRPANTPTRELTAADVAAIAYIASFLDGYKAPEQIGRAVWDVADTIKRLAADAARTEGNR